MEINYNNSHSHENYSDHSEIDSCSIFSNKALKLLYDKSLLSTLNKAIGDTAISWFSYIYKKNKASNDYKENCDENIIRSLNIFSNDLVDVLSTIIQQSKNSFIKTKFEKVNSNVNSSREPLQSNNYNSILNISPRKMFDFDHKKMPSPAKVFKEDKKTPVSKKKQNRNSIRISTWSNEKSKRHSSPFQNVSSELSKYQGNYDWISKSTEKGYSRNLRAQRGQINLSKSRNPSKGMRTSLTTTNLHHTAFTSNELSGQSNSSIR